MAKTSTFLGIAVFLRLSSGVVARQYNATSDIDNIVCVYPISGQYGLLNRVLFYLLWVVVISCSKWTWPAIGSMAYVMTYSATSAVHALVITVTSANGLLDLDVAGAWAILSFSTVIGAPIAYHSSRIRHSAYLPVFAFWCTVIAIGAGCCMVTLSRDYPEEHGCWSESNDPDHILLTEATQLLKLNQFNCSYYCFSTSQITRDPSDITVVAAKRAFGILYTLCLASLALSAVLGVIWCLLGCCFAAECRRTREELIFADKERRKAIKERETRSLRRRSCLVYLNPLALPVVITFNEAYLIALQPLPVGEAPYSVGQWGSWVTVGLAFIAAAINAEHAPRWAKLQRILKKEVEEGARQPSISCVPQIKVDSASTRTGKGQSSWHEFAPNEAPTRSLPPPKSKINVEVPKPARFTSHRG